MNLIATKKHRKSYPNPIAFEPGDKLKLGDCDDEYPGWIWVATQDGNEGWAPEQYLAIEESNGTATALEVYTANELDTHLGERLKLIQELNQWVLVQNSQGAIGWVPLDTTTPA